jgi:hypothetical protein
MIAPEQERAATPTGAGFTDAVTVAFADAAPGGAAGLVRLALSVGEDGERTGSVLGVLFDGREHVAAVARGGLPLPADADWEALALPGARTGVQAPLRRWTAALAGDDGDGFSVELDALGGAAEQGPGHAIARQGGMAGYEQLCRVRGVVRVGGAERPVRCLGQRGHAWGVPDWDRMDAARTVTAWLGEDRAYALSAVRPAGAAGHEADAVWGAVLGGAVAGPIADPRLSTAWDAGGRQRRAGLELWLDEDGHPERAAGVARCGATLDLGRLRLDCAFFTWVGDGRAGVGRYDVLRRA